MYLVALVVRDGKVALLLEHVHPWIAELMWMPLPEPVRERVSRSCLNNVRAMLPVLDTVRRAQAEYERQIAVLARSGRPMAGMHLVTPLVVMDACTLVMGVAGLSATRDMGVTCDRCGASWAGFSSTPPIVRRGKLAREPLDRVVEFCWTCFRRRGGPEESGPEESESEESESEESGSVESSRCGRTKKVADAPRGTEAPAGPSPSILPIRSGASPT